MSVLIIDEKSNKYHVTSPHICINNQDNILDMKNDTEGFY